MAKKPNLKTILSGYAATTALNENFEALRDALDNTVSRDGSVPNSMSADLDMNSQDILNVNTINTSSMILNGTLVTPSGVDPVLDGTVSEYMVTLLNDEDAATARATLDAAASSHTHVIADITDFTDNSTNWNTAYDWGDHSVAGYLTGISGQSIKNLSDVYSSMSPTDGQALVYDTTNGWQAEDIGLTASQVGDATAGLNFGDVGSYAWLAKASYGSPISSGSTYAGSGLYPAAMIHNNFDDADTACHIESSKPQTGTWLALGGQTVNAADHPNNTTLFLRIA